MVSPSLRAPAVLNWRKRRIMGKQLYAVNLSSMQRHGKALKSYSLYFVGFRKRGSTLRERAPPPSDALTCRGYEGSDRGRHLILYAGRRVTSRLTGKHKRIKEDTLMWIISH